MKSVLKEIVIIILLCIAIFLILGVIFYSYIPTNKVLPSNIEAYQTSNELKEEINEDVVEYPKQNIVLEITDSDLTIYKQSQSYDPGKANPFGNNIIVDNNNTTPGSSQSTSTVVPSTSAESSSGTYINKSNSEVVSNSSVSFEDTKLK